LRCPPRGRWGSARGTAAARASAELLDQHRDDLAVDRLFADLDEAEPLVEAHGRLVRRLDVHLAGEPRRASCELPLEVPVQGAAEPEPPGVARDRDPVDVGEIVVTAAEPLEVRARVIRVRREADEVARD